MRHLQFSALFLLVTSCLTAQSVPATINYQGRLTDNSPSQTPINATVNMTFEIWDAPSAGARLWLEPASGASSVVVTGGIFNAILGASAGGSSVPIPASVFTTGTTSRYLQIIANGETLTPRQRISATGYANQAQNAATAASATTAATATNSTQLGGVASGSWQRALGGSPSCGSGLYFNAIYQDGSFGCANPQAFFTAPLTLTGSLSGAIISGDNTGAGRGLSGTTTGTDGVYGQSSGLNGAGVRGWSTNATSGYGVYGQTSGNGSGIFGFATAASGVNFGVRGITNSASGYAGYFDGRVAINGKATSFATLAGDPAATLTTKDYVDSGAGVPNPLALSGSVAGPVISGTHTGSGAGVYGENSSTSSNVYAVHGKISSTSAGNSSAGVRGENLSSTGTGFGVYGSHASGSAVTGEAFGATGTGVYGFGVASSGVNYGVYGTTNSGSGYAGYFYGTSTGTTLYSRGLLEVISFGNNATNNTARFSASGLVGTKYDSHIHYGTTGDWYIRSALATGKVIMQDTGGDTLIGTTGPAIARLTVAGGLRSTALSGVSTLTDGTGILGQADTGTLAYGVWGKSTSGFAGYFSGNVSVVGTLAKSAGSFKIDHPLDPENKYLYHSFVESPDMKNIYDGNTFTDGRGEATVTLPNWFESLNRDFRYQLTVIGEFAQAIVGKKIAGNQFTIKTSKPNVEVSWQVTGIRKDPYAEKHRIPVEQDKPEAERGFYLHPGDYDQPEEKGAEWGTHPELMRRMKEEREKALAPPEPAAAPVP